MNSAILFIPAIIPDRDCKIEYTSSLLSCNESKCYNSRGNSFRGKGYGSRLLKEIERCYINKRFELFTSTRSVDNIRLYERLGYKTFDQKAVTDELVFVYMEKESIG